MKMRKTVLLVTTVLGAGLLGGAAHAEGDLYIYNWTDYTAPDLIAKFEKETGIKVTLDTYDSNETLLAKLKAGGSYDIVVATNYFVQSFIEQGLLKKIDGPSLAGYNNVGKRWQSPPWDPGNAYTLPYAWGTTGLSVNTKEVKFPVDSWATLFDPPKELYGKIGMMGTAGDVIYSLELYLGKGLCQTDKQNVKKIEEILLKQAPAVKVYNNDGITERQTSGETWISVDYNGSAMRERLANPDIKYVYPKEGVLGWMDNVAVPAHAQHPENARKFLEFLLKPENIAIQSNFSRYSNGIDGSEKFMDPALASAPEMTLPPDAKVVFLQQCSAEAIKLRDRVWTRLRR